MKTIINFLKPKKGSLILLILISTLSFAQSNNGSISEQSELITVNDKDLVWHPAPDFLPKCTFTVLHGDIS